MKNWLKTGKILVVALIAILAMGFVIPSKTSASSTIIKDFHLGEINYNGNASVSDLFTHSEKFVTVNASVVDEAGLKVARFNVWHTAGNCDYGQSAGSECKPAGINYAHFEVSISGTSAVISNKIIEKQIKQLGDGSWVVQMEVENMKGQVEKSSYARFWTETRNPNSPSFTTVNSSKFKDSVNLNWTTSDDQIAPSNLSSGVYGYNVVVAKNTNFQTYAFDSKVIANNSIVISNLEAGDYFAKVRSADRAGNYSEWSDMIAFTLAKGTVAGDDDKDTSKTDADKDSNDKITTNDNDSDNSGIILGTSDDKAPEVKAEAKSFMQKLGDWFKWLLKQWWFWLIIALIVAFIIWLLTKKKDDDEDEKKNETKEPFNNLGLKK